MYGRSAVHLVAPFGKGAVPGKETVSFPNDGQQVGAGVILAKTLLEKPDLAS